MTSLHRIALSQELCWYLMKATKDNSLKRLDEDEDPIAFLKKVKNEIFECSSVELEGLRAGAFFVCCDEECKDSEVYKTLTESCIAMPKSNFYDRNLHSFQSYAGGDHSVDHGMDEPGLMDALRDFVGKDRLSDEYHLGQHTFKQVSGRVFPEFIRNSLSLMQIVLGMEPETLALMVTPVQTTLKTLLSNVQVLSEMQYAFATTFPEEMVKVMVRLKLVALDFLADLDLSCVLGTYSYIEKRLLTVAPSVAKQSAGTVAHAHARTHAHTPWGAEQPSRHLCVVALRATTEERHFACPSCRFQVLIPVTALVIVFSLGRHHGPSSPKPASCSVLDSTLNAIGQSRVTLSLR